MIDLTEEQWDNLFDKVDETVTKAMDELPESTRKQRKLVAWWINTPIAMGGICLVATWLG